MTAGNSGVTAQEWRGLLGNKQVDALKAIANGGAVYSGLAPMSWSTSTGFLHHSTVRALHRRGLIEGGPRMRLSDAGRAVVALLEAP